MGQILKTISNNYSTANGPLIHSASNAFSSKFVGKRRKQNIIWNILTKQKGICDIVIKKNFDVFASEPSSLSKMIALYI